MREREIESDREREREYRAFHLSHVIEWFHPSLLLDEKVIFNAEIFLIDSRTYKENSKVVVHFSCKSSKKSLDFYL